MSRFLLPAAPEARARAGVQCDISPRALEAWNPGLHAAAGDDADNTISIYAPIGDFYGEGVTARRIAGALRGVGTTTDVTVNINSPGGDVFEGLAIYNLFREHKGQVTVNVMGLAASAASFIAMAADEIRIGRAAFFMVHNAWTIALGNRNDLREIADFLEPIDFAMADIYTARTGIAVDDVKAQLDAETWIGGRAAVDAGWADAFLETDEIEESSNARTEYRNAVRRMDIAMAKAGLPRSERRSLMQQFKSGTHDAADNGMPGATDHEAETADAFAEFSSTLARFQ